MGCKQSTIQDQDPIPQSKNFDIIIPPDSKLQQLNTDIEELQELARQQDEDKVKMLLLGTGESGKSTIFKQFRILYGSEKTDEDLRMYGVIVRSNIATAVRKICKLTKEMGHIEMLDEESAEETLNNREDCCGMTVREAYDQCVANLVDYNAAVESHPGTKQSPLEHAEQEDWVGESSWAGAIANKDAKLFLANVEAIRVLWQVCIAKYICFTSSQFEFQIRIPTSPSLYLSFTIKNCDLFTFNFHAYPFWISDSVAVENNSKCMDESG